MKDRLTQANGNWVAGERFWDREDDIALFIERINEGAHLLLVAQRRMGKTSLMREAARRLKDRYVCIFVDLQKACSAPDAVVELSIALQPHKTLWNKTKEVFSNILERVEKIGIGDLGVTLRAGLTAGNWADKGDELFGILAASEKRVVLFLDEVPIMVNRMLRGEDYAITPERKAETDQFLSWLRKNSIQHQGKVCIVLSGSVGFEPILHQAHLSTALNNFVPFELKAWDEKTAVECIQALAREYGVELENGAEMGMVRRLGCCIPHHVQMFFMHARDTCKRRGRMAFSVDEVEKVYETEMLGIRGHVELTHYEERLKLVLGKEAFPLALEMLTEAAVTGHLTREALAALQNDYAVPDRNLGEVQKEILWVLEHDGYLKPEPKGYVFESTLLRDWWERRHRFFFTPVLKR